ncbi:Protein of unknown function [Gryllus bimaculatus]|nr:Protein of unknown function [Gryllus bimaculatus]
MGAAAALRMRGTGAAPAPPPPPPPPAVDPEPPTREGLNACAVYLSAAGRVGSCCGLLVSKLPNPCSNNHELLLLRQCIIVNCESRNVLERKKKETNIFTADKSRCSKKKNFLLRQKIYISRHLTN